MSSEKLFESFDDEEYWNPNEVTTKVEFSKPEIEREGRYKFTIVNALISDLSSGKSRDFTIQYTESEYSLTVEVYDDESQLDETHIYMESTSLENDFDTEKRTDWLYDNLPDFTKKLLHSKMLSKDLSEKLAYTILSNATDLAVGNSFGAENLQETTGEKNARRRLWGPDWNNEYADTGVSNLDYFGNHLIEEIKANLEEITCKVGGKIKLAIDEKRTELSMDKDPAPGESVKERRIRGWVYFKSNFNVIMEDRQILKQKVIQAFKGGMADFNDKYKSDYLVCKDMTLISDSFKYGNDNKSMYFVFKVEEEKYHNEKPRAVIVESLDIFDSILKESLTKCRESLFDDLNEYQIGVIRDMAKMDIECGHPMDYDNALAICQEDEDLSDVAEDAAEYYIDLVDKGAAAFYEEFKNEYDDWDPDFVAEFGYEDELLHESYHCWEDFYEKGCKLGLNSYMNKLDILHDDYGGFKNVPKDKIRVILEAIPDNNYDVYNFTEEMIDYFGFDLW